MAESADIYQAVLADLLAKRARLDQLIAGIEAEMQAPNEGPRAAALKDSMTPGSSGSVAVASTIHPDTFFGLSIGEAAKKFLKMARRAQHTTAIADALAQGGLKRPTDNVMSGTLIRAAKGRDIVKVGKGMWGLSEWYPKPPKEPTEERRKRPEPPKAVARKVKKVPKPKAAPAALPARREATGNGAGAPELLAS